MGNDLSQDGLGLVAKRVVWSIIPVRSEFEGFCELPFQVNGQADRNLIASEATVDIIIARVRRLLQLTYL